MPEDLKPASTVVQAAESTERVVEQPTEQVAASMDEAANAVGEAAEDAAEAGQDALANRLAELETTLRGHLQHPHDHAEPTASATETVQTPVAAETVEVEVPQPVVKPRKLHPYQRARFL